MYLFKYANFVLDEKSLIKKEGDINEKHTNNRICFCSIFDSEHADYSSSNTNKIPEGEA